MREIVRSFASLRRHLSVVACLFALSGGGAFGAEPTVAVAVAQAGKAFSVDAMVDVPVSVATAWGVMTDFDNMTAILGNLTSSKVTSRAGNTWIVRQQGVAKYGFLSFAFESEREMRLEPMKRILAKSLSGTAKRMESEAKLMPLGRGVQIRYHAEVEPDSMLARMFGAPFVRHEVEEQFILMSKEMMRRQPPPAAGVFPPSLGRAGAALAQAR